MYEPTYNQETKNSQIISSPQVETPPYIHKTLNYSLFQMVTCSMTI